MMTILLTFNPNGRGPARAARWCAALAAAVSIAVAMPATACDKAPITPVASAPAGAGVFTGEWVNGAPVYRLPPINVVGHRQAEVAKTQRGDRSARNVQSRAGSALAAPIRNRSVVTASRDASAVKPCIG
jgi:hypothetical protein